MLEECTGPLDNREVECNTKKVELKENIMRPPSTSKVPKSFKSDTVCTVCEKTFSSEQTLKYHIRQQHFNLKGKTPYCEMKKVNQVWFEKVLNSNNVIEIKKTGNNTLLMKRLSSNTAIKVKENDTKVIDVTHIYPLNKRNSKIKCKQCNKFVLRCNLQRHLRSVTSCQPDAEDNSYVS